MERLHTHIYTHTHTHTRTHTHTHTHNDSIPNCLIVLLHSYIHIGLGPSVNIHCITSYVISYNLGSLYVRKYEAIYSNSSLYLKG